LREHCFGGLLAAMISLDEGRGSGSKRNPRGGVYSLRLTVGEVQPRIWRRLLVRETMWLSRLHDAIQVLFGWYDYQTHVFVVGDRRHGNPVNRDGVVIGDDRDVTLAELRFSGRDRLAYDYRFAEGWHVDLRVEKTLAAEKGGAYPKCVAGASRLTRTCSIASNTPGPISDANGGNGSVRITIRRDAIWPQSTRR
jgi:hypothetical protein